MKPLLHMLVFQTDFGYRDSTVAAMYGVVKSVDRSIEVIDSTHELPPFDIWSASYRLIQALRFWPKGTIFVSVVDPGVGMKRRASVALTEDGYYIVTPDNGSLTHAAFRHGIAAIHEIDTVSNRLHRADTDETAVFHGRDLFGYCAARLAAGIIDFEEVGPAYDPSEVVTLPLPAAVYEEGHVKGTITIDDPNFGNLFTSLDTRKVLRCGFSYGEDVQVTIAKGEIVYFAQNVRFDTSFGKVAKGEPIVYNNELMMLALAVSQGSFCDTYAIGYGPEWVVELRRKR